jgi:GNAT superfamily N-acetyltransferase
MIVRRAIFADLPAIRIGFAHLVAELEAERLVPYPTHDAGTLDDFTVHLAGRIGVDPRLLLYVALEDESRALLGFLGGDVSERALGYPTRFGAAHWLYVAPVARKLGVARALVRLACEDLLQLGITHVELASLTNDMQWLNRGWAPYLVHYVLPLEGVMAGAAERLPAPAPALEPPPALEVPEPEPERLAASNGNAREPIDRARSVDVLRLGGRAANCLQNADIHSLDDLVRVSARELLRTKNLGKKSLAEIRAALAERGLALRNGSTPHRRRGRKPYVPTGRPRGRPRKVPAADRGEP